jgi:hypothetical protein
MDRRTALATAAAIAVVAITGAAAIAANLGMLDRTATDPVGQLQPTDPELTTVVVEPSSDAAATQPAAQPSTREDDVEVEYEDGDEGEREREDDEYEYEGRDDDD